MEKRWSEIQNIWRNNQVLYVTAGFLGGILFFPAIEAFSTDASDLLSSFVPEAVGIAFTVLLIDRLNENRALRQYKEQLIRNAGSQSRDTAVSAVNEMRKRGWLTWNNNEPLLRKADLESANLFEAHLMQADLTETNLSEANLAYADLLVARLRRTNMTNADLSNTLMFDADIRNADLELANLCGSELGFADLSDAILVNADLSNATMQNATFSPNTLLPDGSNWTPDTDMARFTDPNHPDFWQPDWVKPQQGE